MDKEELPNEDEEAYTQIGCCDIPGDEPVEIWHRPDLVLTGMRGQEGETHFIQAWHRAEVVSKFGLTLVHPSVRPFQFTVCVPAGNLWLSTSVRTSRPVTSYIRTLTALSIGSVNSICVDGLNGFG